VEAPLRVPFGFYSVPREQFSRLADAGVTMVGPYYGPTPSVALLDDAKAMGLGVVYPVGADGVDAVGAQVDAVAGHDAVVAWYVLPEELRPWVPAEVEYLDTVRRAVHGSDARRRPLLSYQPNHADRARLVAISAAFDIVSRGLYAGYVGQGERRTWVRVGAETIVAAAGPEQSAWAVLEMFQQPAEHSRSRIAAWARHDVYASLVAGAEGILVFSGWPRKGFDDYETYLEAYLSVARELNGPQAIGTAVLRGVPSSQVRVTQVEGPASVEIGEGTAVERVPAVASAVLEDRGAVWVFVVNSAERSVALEIDTPCPLERVVGPSVHGGRLVLPPLGVAVLRTAAHEESTAI